MTKHDLVCKPSPFPTLVIPLGKDGSVSHAICIVDDLVFDSTQPCALKSKFETLDCVCNCGGHGFADVNVAIRFREPYKTPALKREVRINW